MNFTFNGLFEMKFVLSVIITKSIVGLNEHECIKYGKYQGMGHTSK